MLHAAIRCFVTCPLAPDIGPILFGPPNPDHVLEMDSDDEGSFHDEVEIEDFTYDEETDTFTYPCPCGDMFTITREELLKGEDVAECPSCSLIVKVIYNKDEIEDIVKEKSTAKNKTQSPAIKTT